jgi:hypothetical protein
MALHDHSGLNEALAVPPHNSLSQEKISKRFFASREDMKRPCGGHVSPGDNATLRCGNVPNWAPWQTAAGLST